MSASAAVLPLVPPPDGWRAALDSLPLPAWRYYARVGSTNDVARQWAALGATEGCLVIAETQTAGRGRRGRRWYTPPGTALALSLVVRPLPGEAAYLTRYAAWAALAMVQVLEAYGVPVQLKWPNDLLLAGRKVGGVLAEAQWQGERLDVVVIGLGLNVWRGSAPRPEAVDYPAADLESLTGRRLPRPTLVAGFWQRWAWWRPRLGQPAFVRAWEARLAFRGRRVQITAPDGTTWAGVLVGLTPHGHLRLHTALGERTAPYGATLRPMEAL